MPENKRQFDSLGAFIMISIALSTPSLSVWEFTLKTIINGIVILIIESLYNRMRSKRVD